MGPDRVACLRVVVDSELADTATHLLEEQGATAIETRDPHTLTPAVDGAIDLLAGFTERAARDRARSRLSHLLGASEITSLEIGDDGWSERWREFHAPVVLDTMQVITPWAEPREGDPPAIVIDPGRAFGTGGHATTLLLLELLESRARDGRLPADVLDVGTGSGVLAIAAIALGASRVTAIDHDADAVAAAGENAAVNRVEHSIVLRRATPTELEGSWPLVLANLDLATFESCARDIARVTAPGGELLLSGLLSEQVAPSLSLWPDFSAGGSTRRDGWAAVTLRRNR